MRGRRSEGVGNENWPCPERARKGGPLRSLTGNHDRPGVQVSPAIMRRHPGSQAENAGPSSASPLTSVYAKAQRSERREQDEHSEPAAGHHVDEAEDLGHGQDAASGGARHHQTAPAHTADSAFLEATPAPRSPGSRPRTRSARALSKRVSVRLGALMADEAVGHQGWRPLPLPQIVHAPPATSRAVTP